VEAVLFEKNLKFARERELIIGTKLSAFFNCSFSPGDEKTDPAHWDYILFSMHKGFLLTVEQKDDFYLQDARGTMLFELYTHISANKTKPGFINYTKAKRIIYVVNRLKQVILLDTKKLKNLIYKLENFGLLKTYTPYDVEKWRSKHGSLPTTSALIPYEEVLLNDSQARVLTFDELDIPQNYYELKHQQP
jgi:hypothetical protein